MNLRTKNSGYSIWHLTLTYGKNIYFSHLYAYNIFSQFLPTRRGRSLRLYQTCMYRSCLVRVVQFVKMFCYNVNSPDAPKSAPCHEYYGFK